MKNRPFTPESARALNRRSEYDDFEFFTAVLAASGNVRWSVMASIMEAISSGRAEDLDFPLSY